MKLSDLKPGQSGQVVALSALCRDVRKKLMVMGLLPATRVTLLRRAPLGDPLQIEVRGVSIALRESIASTIEVEAEQ